MSLPRVLVRWLPTPELQKARSLDIGARWALPLQQNAFDMHEPLYAEFAVLAEAWLDGFLALNVGFEAEVAMGSDHVYLKDEPRVVTKVGFLGHIQAALKSIGAVNGPRRWDVTPTGEGLLKQALEDYAARGGRAEAYADAVAQMRARVAAVAEAQERQVQEDAKRHRETSIFTDIERFNAVAQPVPTTGEPLPLPPRT